MLVQAGWDSVHAVDKKFSTALHWAAGNGHLDVVAFLLPLLPRGHVDCRNKQGRTALMHAAKNGHLPVVKLLVEGQPGLAWEDRASVHIRMKDGSSVFDWAVFGGNTSVMAYLKDDVPGLDVHSTNISGCGAAHWAGATGNVATCKWLFANGFDLGVTNHANHGLVNSAAYKGFWEVVQWAVAAPEGPRLWEQLRLKDHGGVTLVQNCRAAGHSKLAEWLEAVDAERGPSPETQPLSL